MPRHSLSQRVTSTLIRRRCFGRPLAGIEHAQVPAARDDVGVGQMSGQLGNSFGLVLAVAVERHDAVVAAGRSSPRRPSATRPHTPGCADGESSGPSGNVSATRACGRSSRRRPPRRPRRNFSTSVSTPTRLASSLWTGMAVSRRMGKSLCTKSLAKDRFRRSRRGRTRIF